MFEPMETKVVLAFERSFIRRKKANEEEGQRRGAINVARGGGPRQGENIVGALSPPPDSHAGLAPQEAREEIEKHSS